MATSNPLVQRLIATGDLAVEPKQAWTPVAESRSPASTP